MISRGRNICTKPSVRTKNVREPGYVVFVDAIICASGSCCHGYLLGFNWSQSAWLYSLWDLNIPLPFVPPKGTQWKCLLSLFGFCVTTVTMNRQFGRMCAHDDRPFLTLALAKTIPRNWQFEKAWWAPRAPQKGNAELVLSEDIRSERSWKKWISYWYKP